jgi:alkylated DNA repair dioxygenase AlkB
MTEYRVGHVYLRTYVRYNCFMIASFRQYSLFEGTVSDDPTVCADVPGLTYVKNFLSEAEQDAIVAEIDKNKWSGELARRIQHYGYRYNYKARRLDSGMYLGELPAWMHAVAVKLYEAGYTDAVSDQGLANEYMPGQGIAPHVDCEPYFGNIVISLSLLSPCVMNFNRVGCDEQASLLLEPCSIVVLKDEARYKWTHGIPKRLKDTVDGVTYTRGRRVSLTFRKAVIDKL